MNSDHIVVDVEIQKTIDEVPGGWNATDQLGVACAVIYEYQTDRFRIYGPDDVQGLRERLIKATRISGFNIYKFDYNVIFGHPGNWRKTELLPKTNDVLRRIWESKGLDGDVFTGAHKGWSLDNVTLGTLGVGKIGNGAEAPIWYQNGELHRVINYCVDDVTLERDLVNFIDKYGFVVNGKSGEVLRITK